MFMCTLDGVVLVCGGAGKVGSGVGIEFGAATVAAAAAIAVEVEVVWCVSAAGLEMGMESVQGLLARGSE